MVDDYMLNEILEKIKEIIGFKQFDNTNILIGKVEIKFLNNVT